MTSASLAIVDDRKAHQRFFLFNALLSVAVLGFLAWLLGLRSVHSAAGHDLGFLPAVNAGFNATAAVLLTAGWIAIRNGKARLHRYLMVSAFCSSALFFVSYVIYHFVHGDTKYAGTGPLRVVYFGVLATHVLLATIVVPMALTAFWFAYRRRFDLHKRVTRIGLPIWLYVSVTGVLIFFLLRAESGP